MIAETVWQLIPIHALTRRPRPKQKGDYIYMVVNGATKFGDMKHFQEQMEKFDGEVCMDYLEDSMQLLALQGPGAAEAIAKILPADFDLINMPFMTGTETTLDGIEGCRITRYVWLDWM